MPATTGGIGEADGPLNRKWLILKYFQGFQIKVLHFFPSPSAILPFPFYFLRFFHSFTILSPACIICLLFYMPSHYSMAVLACPPLTGISCLFFSIGFFYCRIAGVGPGMLGIACLVLSQTIFYKPFSAVGPHSTSMPVELSILHRIFHWS